MKRYIFTVITAQMLYYLMSTQRKKIPTYLLIERKKTTRMLNALKWEEILFFWCWSTMGFQWIVPTNIAVSEKVTRYWDTILYQSDDDDLHSLEFVQIPSSYRSLNSKFRISQLFRCCTSNINNYFHDLGKLWKLYEKNSTRNFMKKEMDVMRTTLAI